jgi:phosphonopyruvate decarboxylase
MLNQEKLINALQRQGVKFFAGVPDSFLNGFCTHLASLVSPECHVIAANEGNAVAIAAGYHLATGTIPLVYMQNSGMGNTINPLLSLTEKHVYSIPMVLLIGWRGQNGIGDHEQHIAQGRLTIRFLNDLEIPYRVLSDDDTKAAADVVWGVQTAHETSLPVALVVPKGVCTGEKKFHTDLNDFYNMSREDVISTLLDNCPANTLYIATTGRTTRELYFQRQKRKQDTSCDFLNVGAMGHTLSIAQGFALAAPSRPVICLDGDASAIMHMGSLTMSGNLNIPNLLHIILNNGSHESVGGQPSVGHLIDFTLIAEGCGYETVAAPIETKQGLMDALARLTHRKRAALLDIRIQRRASKKLPPLNASPLQLKSLFIGGSVTVGK